MIVDLNLKNKKVIIIGGGNEALKRTYSLLKQECEIIVISKKVNSTISKLAESKKIKLKKINVKNVSFISKFSPNLVITTTDDRELNQEIIEYAKKKKVIVYSSDNPDDSDFANPAIIDIENIIQVAIFTGGRSPTVSKHLRVKFEEIFKKNITKEEINQIRIQKIARELAKEKISNQTKRKEYLRSIIVDNEIDQLIKDGKLKKAEKRAITKLRDWK